MGCLDEQYLFTHEGPDPSVSYLGAVSNPNTGQPISLGQSRDSEIWGMVSGEAKWELFRQLVPPPAEGGRPVDWGRLGESWGKTFPRDYRRFIEEYEPGTIAKVLGILGPAPSDGLSGLGDDDVSSETENARSLWGDTCKSPELAGACPELIAWGVDNGGGVLCWDSSAENPDDWPVLVYHRGDVVWRKYDCGMVEFILRILRADLDKNPLSVGELWGAGSATFQSLREQLSMYGESPYGDEI